jgi:hypothetical protein
MNEKAKMDLVADAATEVQRLKDAGWTQKDFANALAELFNDDSQEEKDTTVGPNRDN